MMNGWKSCQLGMRSALLLLLLLGHRATAGGGRRPARRAGRAAPAPPPPAPGAGGGGGGGGRVGGLQAPPATPGRGSADRVRAATEDRARIGGRHSPEDEEAPRMAGLARWAI